MFQYYHKYIRSLSQIMRLLTDLCSSKRLFTWTEIHTKALEEIDRTYLLTFPNFSKSFEIFTDISDLQIRAVIMQENQPIVFFSHKMTSSQLNYIVMEKELLLIVEILQEY